MTKVIERQLVDYGRHLQHLVEEMEVSVGAEPLARTRPARERRRRLAVALAAFAAPLVLIGGLVLLLRSTGEQQPPVASEPPQPQPTAAPQPEPTAAPETEPLEPPVTPEGMIPVEVDPMVTVSAGLAPDRPLKPDVGFQPDDLTWSRVEIPDNLFRDVEYASRIVSLGSRLVLLGREDCDGERHAAVWVSDDGHTWSRVPDDVTFQLTPPDSPQCPVGFRDVVVGGPGLVAVGDTAGPGPNHAIKATVWISADGLNWSRLSPDGDNESMTEHTRLWSVYLGGPGLVGIGEACESAPGCEPHVVIWTSPDGLTWTRVESLDPEFESTLDEHGSGSFIDTVAANTERMVAVSPTERGLAFWTSQDGTSWRKLPLEDTSPQPCFQWLTRRLAASDTAFVAVRTCNSPGGSEPSWSVYYSTVWTSQDGRHWTASAFDPNTTISDVVGVGSGFIAVGGTAGQLDHEPSVADYEPVVWTSVDGYVWIPVNLDPINAGRGKISDVALTESGLVAVGQSPEGPTIWVAAPTSNP